MIFVYIIETTEEPKRFYVGVTENIELRLEKHNSGQVPHTAKFKPWFLKNYFAFKDQKKAFAFEKYLKSGSGRSFAKKHF